MNYSILSRFLTSRTRNWRPCADRRFSSACTLSYSRTAALMLSFALAWSSLPSTSTGSGGTLPCGRRWRVAPCARVGCGEGDLVQISGRVCAGTIEHAHSYKLSTNIIGATHSALQPWLSVAIHLSKALSRAAVAPQKRQFADVCVQGVQVVHKI